MQTLGQNPTEEEVKTMIAEADTDGTGDIDFKEFCHLLHKRQSDSEQDEELIEVFKNFDTNQDEVIDAEDLKRIFVELGHDITYADCEMLVQMHDIDQDGYLNFQEFTSAFMAN